MKQEVIAGICMFLIGLFVITQPYKVWKITEKWKSESNTQPSESYLSVTRIVSSVMIAIGILLMMGVIH